MRKTDFLSGLILGGIIGAAVVLLYTPASGTNMRVRARNLIDDVREEIKQAATTRRAEMEHELSVLRAPNAPTE
jgi:gas vesicle protein